MMEFALDRLQKSITTRFLAIFTTCFIYKLIFSWNSGINNGWQDELGWKSFADSHGFITTISQYDSGYPTPILRALSYLLTQIAPNSFLVWHLIVLVFISGSIASLVFSRLLSWYSVLLISAVLCSYPSFDLLLLHNLSYWSYIPLFILLTNVVAQQMRLSNRLILIIFVLTIASAKPQLLLSILALISLSFFSQKLLRKRILLISILLIVLFLAGRLSTTRIDLNVDIYSILNFLATFLSHITITLFPTVTIAVFGFTKVYGFHILITIFYIITFVMPIIIWRTFNRASSDINVVLPVFFSFMVCSGSLYLFGNSGWSQNNLLVSSTYTSLFSRHYLPVVINVTFLILLKYQRNKFFHFILATASAQYVVLQIILYRQLYQPA